MTVHPLIKRLLDGDIELSDLPPALRPEGERALQLFKRLDRSSVSLPARVEDRVLAQLQGLRVTRARPLPWLAGTAVAAVAVAAVAVIALVARRPSTSPAAFDDARVDSALVRFVYYAPRARSVTVAGSFNDWSLEASPLARGERGVWAITLSLPTGQHQYAFVVDGREWTADPAAPAVDDGLGHRNSVVAVGVSGGRVL
jgi:hypothetical protein